MSDPLWSDERIADAAAAAWRCYDFRLGARIEMKKMRNEYEARIAELEAQLAIPPIVYEGLSAALAIHDEECGVTKGSFAARKWLKGNRKQGR